MSQPLISVIIPNYNNEAYLEECLLSVVSQDYPNLEILVIDDCSSDGSVSILKRLSDEYSNLKVVYKDNNEGVVKARKTGLDNASGELLSTLDSDDIYLSETKLSKEYEAVSRHFKKGSEVIGYSNICLLLPNGKSVPHPQKNADDGDVYRQLLERSTMIPRDFLFSKNLYNTVGGFDNKIPIYEDWDLKIRMSECAHFYYSGVDGIGYRQHGQGLSSTSSARILYWLFRVFLKNSKTNRFSDYLVSIPGFCRFYFGLAFKLLKRKALSK